MIEEEKITELIRKARALNPNVKIVPATKTRTAEEINGLLKYGINSMGENRVQELLGKIDDVKLTDIHFIGALQTNKVKYIAGRVGMIQSVDRRELVDEIEKRCAAAGKTMEILIEVNVGGEESKSGTTESDYLNLALYAESKPHIKVKGLMSVLPIGAGEELYREMKRCSDRLKEEIPDAAELSMGMSDDYELALKCGATIIRPGTAIFGKRIYPGEKQ